MKQKMMKLARTFAICGFLMASAFIIAFISAYEVVPPEEELPTGTEKLTPIPTIAVTPASEPAPGKGGEEYYTEAMAYMKEKKYESALLALSEAKRLGYDAKEIDSQIMQIKNHTKALTLYKKALEYYEQKSYENAIAAFGELVKIDTAYKDSLRYADSFYQLAIIHNTKGMQHFNEGDPEKSLKEFEAAMGIMARMKEQIKEYDPVKYSEYYSIYIGNKDMMIKKIQQIQESFKLAQEYNKAGVKYFGEEDFKNARSEFEEAVGLLEDIRISVPGYSANDYDRLLQLYKENLQRVKEKL